MKKSLLLIFTLAIFIGCAQNIKVEYPETKKIDVVDDYHGVKVTDPYRWLEDDMSKETGEWVTSQNKVTFSYLDQISFRNKIKDRLTEIWNYERYSAPSKVGENYFFSKNDGLQEQSVIYFQKGLDGQPEVFVDPNTFSEDGTVSLRGLFYSNDDKYAGYGISRGGSDWTEFYVMDIATKTKLSDEILWSKFSGLAWYKDGFFYSRYDEPKEEDKLKGSNEFHKVFYHRLGTPQIDDELIYQDKQNPKRNFYASVTEDERFLLIYVSEGAAGDNMIYYKDLVKNTPIKPVFDNFEAKYSIVNNIGEKLLVMTNYEASNYKLVLVDPTKPDKNNWEIILPEEEYLLRSVSMVGSKLIATYLQDANSKVKVYDPSGKFLYDIELPGIGTVSGFGGKNEDNETFYTFTSYTYPPTIFKYDIQENKSELFRKAEVKFNVDDYETKQVFYNSKDGTRIPMFVVHKKGIKLDGTNPTLLYGYGGFNISEVPSFRLSIIPLLESGFVYATANIRGGGEYGAKWHKAGTLENKQNVFDDFIAASEYLINEKYTSPKKLAVRGGSNGGLLIGAVINQRPDLYGVAFPEVGVMEMLRFHKFTIGWAWVKEYGSSEDSVEFENLYNYSPLHNISSEADYPAVMVITADHDDRVVPAHSFKYIATLQEKYNGNKPVLIRIQTKAGHGGGKPASMAIDEFADKWAFAFYNMGITPKYTEKK